MSEDTEKTTIIPWQEDAPASTTQVLHGRHRVRRGVPMPRWAVAAVFGAPVAATMLAVGMVLPGLVGGGTPRTVASPSRPAAAPTTAEPLPSLPSPRRSRADRSRPRNTRPPAPTPSRRSISPTPTPRTTTPRPSPSPTKTRSSTAPPRSPSPEPPIGSDLPTPLDPSPQETGNG